MSKKTFGNVEVETEKYWGAQTQRSLNLFAAGGLRYQWRRCVIRALGLFDSSNIGFIEFTVGHRRTEVKTLE